MRPRDADVNHESRRATFRRETHSRRGGKGFKLLFTGETLLRHGLFFVGETAVNRKRAFVVVRPRRIMMRTRCVIQRLPYAGILLAHCIVL